MFVTALQFYIDTPRRCISVLCPHHSILQHFLSVSFYSFLVYICGQTNLFQG